MILGGRGVYRQDAWDAEKKEEEESRRNLSEDFEAPR